MSKRPELIELCKEYLKQKFCRGDYKELVVLTLLYLQDEDTMNNFKRFYRPGAMHKARWMAKLSYAIKMGLLGSIIQRDLPKGQIFARGQLVKLKRFVLFVLYFVMSLGGLQALFHPVPQRMTCFLLEALSTTELRIAPLEKLLLMQSRTTCGTSQKHLFVLLFSVALWTPLSRLKWHWSWYLYRSLAYANLAKGMGSRSHNSLNSLQMILTFRFLLGKTPGHFLRF